MPFPAFSPRRLTGAAALACAAPLMPMTSLVATASPAAAAAATGPPAVPASFQPASASFVSPASGYVLGAVGCTLGHVCSARLVSTTDGGARWHFANAPDVALFNSAVIAYVVNQASGTVTPIRTATNTAGKAINVKQFPYAIAITPNGKTAYVTNTRSEERR